MLWAAQKQIEVKNIEVIEDRHDEDLSSQKSGKAKKNGKAKKSKKPKEEKVQLLYGMSVPCRHGLHLRSL